VIKTNRKIRLAFVSTIVYPHWLAFWRELASRPDIQLTVYVCARSEEYRPWTTESSRPGFVLKHMKGVTLPLHVLVRSTARWYAHINPEILGVLLRRRYDAFLTVGWTSPTTLSVLASRKWHRAPVILWDEAIPHPATRLKQFLTPVIRSIIASYDAYFVPGPRTREYLASYGADPGRVYVVGQAAMDHGAFDAALSLAREDTHLLKTRLVGAQKKVILFSGQLIERKGVMDLLDAFRTVKAQCGGAVLVIMGTGPLESKIRRYVSAHGLKDVVLTGFLSVAEFVRYYVIADVFVLPSLYDCFPVVIPEAMYAGLPIITTSEVGCVGTLVKHGENGVVVPPNNSAALAEAVLRLMKDDRIRERMGQRSRALLEPWSMERVIERFVAAVRQVHSNSSGPPTYAGSDG
jgi:glycosyltransferase involved in cell wall biosynthesis